MGHQCEISTLQNYQLNHEMIDVCPVWFLTGKVSSDFLTGTKDTSSLQHFILQMSLPYCSALWSREYVSNFELCRRAHVKHMSVM